ncbi:MAG: FtsX-like permease family protein [Alistipes sp.]|nr:FtsX-like permease family protein [Alistipes sp.]
MFSPKSNSVINIIACVSLVAVAVPTAAMIILLAMVDGLGGVIARLDAAVDADIEVVAERGQTIAVSDIDLDHILHIEGVAAAAPYIEQSVMALAAGRRTTIALRGVNRNYFDVMSIDEFVQAGRLESIYSGDIVLGVGLCTELAAFGIGTEIELFALNRKQISTLLPMSGISRMTTRLGGAVMGNNEISSSLAIAEMERVQRLLNYEGRITAVAIKLRPNADLMTTKSHIESCVGEGIKVMTREEKNASINAIYKMERYTILLIGLMIILIATFSIIGTVIMLITEKQRDIETLKALGAGQRLITSIFVGEGALLTVTGCAIGTLLGCVVALVQQELGLVKIPGDQLIGSYPVDLNIADVALVVVLVLAVGIVISWLTVRAQLRGITTEK